MKITYWENNEEKSIIINPDQKAIHIVKVDFCQVWIINERSGDLSIVSGCNYAEITGYMKNKSKLTKKTKRIS